MMLEFLDKPRQALSNMVQGIGEGDFAKALPGLLGTLGGAGLAATGVGIPLAVLLGSALGGVGQGVASSIDPDTFKADSAEVAGGKMADALGFSEGTFGRGAVGMLSTALTDPLSYAGLGLGSRAGAAAGGALERAALARGPRYGQSANDILGQIMAKEPNHNIIDNFVQHMRQPELAPIAERLAGEIPKGSVPFNSGVEAVAFRSPTGDVVRLGEMPGGLIKKRPIDPDMLQATRIASAGNFMVDRAPYLHGVDSPAAQDAAGLLKKNMSGRGIDLRDAHAGNIGFQGTSPKVLDPGAVSPITAEHIAHQQKIKDIMGEGYPVKVPEAAYSGGFQPVTDLMQQPSKPMNALLSLLGSDKALQRALAMGTQDIGYKRAGQIAGGTVGALLPQAE